MKSTSQVFSAITPFPGFRSIGDAVAFFVVMLVPICILGLLFRKMWLRYTPKGLAFFCLAMAGMGLAGTTGVLATAPSLAPRVTVDGYCYGMREVYVDRIVQHTFALTLDTGMMLQLQTPLTPSWLSEVTDGTRLRVTYLDETRPVFTFPRAIALKVLSGSYVGRSDSVDANWLGAWLLLPIGIAVCLTSVFYAVQNRRSGASSEDTDGRNLDDGQKLNLTDLNLR